MRSRMLRRICRGMIRGFILRYVAFVFFTDDDCEDGLWSLWDIVG